MPSPTTSDSPIAERDGPCYGLSFTRTQCDLLFRLYLDKTVTLFEQISGGFNNLSFFVDVAESDEKYVLKICGRYWHRIKTETEVAALDLVKKYTTIPVPRVLAYSSDKDNEFGVEWIVMSRMPGQSLKPFWESGELTVHAKKKLLKELASYVAQMHNRIPKFNKIGNLTATGEIGPDLNWIGPWSTFQDFYMDRLQAQIDVLETREVFATVKDDMIIAIKEFRQLQFPTLSNLPFVFTHGDLCTQNILISTNDLESPHITAIIDWEWAGSFPCSEEYFLSYDVISGDERAYLYNKLERYGVATPRTIEQFSLIHKMADFKTDVAPWYLVDVSYPDDPIVQNKVDCCRNQALKYLAELRKELGT